MVIFPHGDAPTVAIVGVGDPDPAAVQAVADAYEETFEVPVAVGDPVPLPDDEDAQSGFRDVHDVFGVLDDETDADFTFGVTDEALAHGDDYRPFGVTVPGDGLVLLSTASLWDLSSTDEDERERLANVTRHFAGLTFGFDSHDGCVMAETASVTELDDRPATFCDDCARRLRDPDTAPEPPEWHVVTKDLEEFQTAMRWAEGDIRFAEYPIFALGWAVDTAWRIGSALPSLPNVTVPRSMRALVHESYRTIRFWWLVATYFAVFAGVVTVGFSGYETVFGGEPTDTATWVIAVAGLPLAFVVHAILRGVVGGAFAGLVLGTREGLRAEE